MKKILIASALVLGVALNASAQQEKCCGKGRLHSWSYIEAQGGLQLTATDAPMDKLLTPTVSLSFGHYFTPAVGARIGVNAWQSKAGFDDKVMAPWVSDVYYKWKYVTPSLDLLLNLSNIFDPKNPDQLMNVILVGGVGVNYAWDNGELRDLNLPAEQAPLTNLDECRLSHNLRAGLRVETRQSWPFGVSLEVAANNVEDRFNAKFNNNSDWQFTAQLGLLWRFGQKYKQCNKQVEQPQNLTLYQQMLKTVDERMKQWRQRMKDENNAQLTNDDIEAQRLQYIKDVSTEMAGNRINKSLNNVTYDQEAEAIVLNFNGMPSINLKDVPASCLPHFEDVDNVRFQNTVYNLRPDDTFEILYTEVLDNQGHKYIYRKGDNSVTKQQVKQPVAPVQPQTNTQAVVDRLKETIYYELRASDPKGNDDVMRRVADFMKRNSEAKVMVVGYADRETGNPRINAGYARQRAQRAKQMLVKQYGCDAKRINATSKGDTEQPFSDNAKNRCVIITGEGK